MAATVIDHLRWVRTSERLRSLLPLMKAAHGVLAEVLEMDPELAPEITAILDGMLEMQEAIVRALTFMDARLEAKEGA